MIIIFLIVVQFSLVCEFHYKFEYKEFTKYKRNIKSNKMQSTIDSEVKEGKCADKRGFGFIRECVPKEDNNSQMKDIFRETDEKFQNSLHRLLSHDKKVSLFFAECLKTCYLDEAIKQTKLKFSLKDGYKITTEFTF